MVSESAADLEVIRDGAAPEAKETPPSLAVSACSDTGLPDIEPKEATQ
ncbi:MAG: hypothetical protein QM625_04510 [Ralstonia sp.]|uniref:Uncharacterized protein n=1 Tax=Ralstonia pickettii TaxID=329 RepID=A0AAW4Q911_RALPI|nr:hypothetical protein [Ralstonia pickettii]MBX3756877.1 hypothetical protein [Ralstonia pickettii]MBX3769649.1 hypothetical protein [Ralstonia pickettii]MBX3779682.1 hypothetical protein [Ralstonia pickettii]MBX3784754.1 hypothetical protein [Ralstonia pickettii]MBX3790072.1 hypothetical protein [Ralstonia pickettii]